MYRECAKSGDCFLLTIEEDFRPNWLRVWAVEVIDAGSRRPEGLQGFLDNCLAGWDESPLVILRVSDELLQQSIPCNISVVAITENMVFEYLLELCVATQ